MRTIKATMPAWITSDYFDPKTLIDGDPVSLINQLSLHGASDMTSYGWVKCGTAEITLDIHDEKDICGQKIEALKAQKNKILADAQLEATQIEGRIQELLCIEFRE